MKKFSEKKIGFLENWFVEKKSIIHLFFNSEKKILNVQMEGIYWAKLGVNIGREIDKMRPVLIFQGNDWIVRNLDMVLVISITSTLKKGNFNIKLDTSDIEEKNVSGMILLQQIKSISKYRLARKITKVKVEKLREVKRKFEKLLYKNTPLSSERKGDYSAMQS